MSKDYSIDFKLDAGYNEINIQKVLQKGLEKGFVYYDHIIGERYETSPVLDAKQAAKKVMKALADGLDGGPAVFTAFQKDEGAHLWFHKTDDGFLEFSAGAFHGVRKKCYYMDFDYYMRFLLDLCVDFEILEIRSYIIG